MRWDENKNIYLTLVGLLPNWSLKQHALAKNNFSFRIGKKKKKLHVKPKPKPNMAERFKVYNFEGCILTWEEYGDCCNWIGTEYANCGGC
jgi:hypothetical protein